MKAEEFNAIMERRLSECRRVLASKSEEYATGADRMHNFRRAGDMLGTTPSSACAGFMVKHLVSVLDLVEDAENGRTNRNHLVDEKIGDAINYLILLEALLKE